MTCTFWNHLIQWWLQKKKENPFNFKLFGKYLLFADTVIWSSIHSGIPNWKIRWETSDSLKREFALYSCEPTVWWTLQPHGQQRKVLTRWWCQILVLLLTYCFSFTHWSEQIAINLKLRYKYTQICTVHIQENIFAFVTSVTLKILESWYLCHWFVC